MKILALFTSGAASFVSFPASAQDIPPAQEPPVEAPSAQDGQIASYSDAQIAGFVAASRALGNMPEMAGADEMARREQAEAVLREHGLEPSEYMAIRRAMETDPAVASRVQQAASDTGAQAQTDTGVEPDAREVEPDMNEPEA